MLGRRRFGVEQQLQHHRRVPLGTSGLGTAGQRHDVAVGDERDVLEVGQQLGRPGRRLHRLDQLLDDGNRLLPDRHHVARAKFCQ